MSRNKKSDRALVVITALILVALLSMGYGFYKLIKGKTGSPCAVEVQFNDSKATYIGRSV
jgi:hypothetical protein